jgi:hypothetical protein
MHFHLELFFCFLHLLVYTSDGFLELFVCVGSETWHKLNE